MKIVNELIKISCIPFKHRLMFYALQPLRCASVYVIHPQRGLVTNVHLETKLRK